MNLARALGHEVGSLPMSDGTPIVFVLTTTSPYANRWSC